MYGQYVQPKKFTFKRVTTGPLQTEGYERFRPQFAEVEETQEAHAYFAAKGSDGLMVQFYEIASDGQFALIRVVDRVADIDKGVVIE